MGSGFLWVGLFGKVYLFCIGVFLKELDTLELRLGLERDWSYQGWDSAVL
jgi:hypothetical protein